MNKCILTIRKSLPPTLLTFVLIIVMVSVETASTIPTQTDPPTTVYLDPPTITGLTIGETFTVNLDISNAQNVGTWEAGMIFNATLLECTGFFEGEFLSDVGPTYWAEGTIDNTLGVITTHGAAFLGAEYKASGDGRLAYLNFRVKAPGVSDLHLRDVTVVDYNHIRAPINVIDVYTVVVDTTPHTVVTVSNLTGKVGADHSGFYDHAFSPQDKEISFKVSQPSSITLPVDAVFSNVSIPKTLLWVDNLDDWTVIIDDTTLSTVERTVTENTTHYSIYFTYGPGKHTIQIIGKYFNWRDLDVSLDIPTFLRPGYSYLLNATVYNLGLAGNETDVTLQLFINGTMVNSTVISTLMEGYNYTISYFWTPPAFEATYNVTAYAPPVSGENVTTNNVETKFVDYIILRELVVSLEAPTFLRLGYSSLLNATVHNFGWINETDVTLQLFINGTMVNSTVISTLMEGYNYTISYFWTPPAFEATYNVTAYAPPVSGENVTTNNVETKFVAVKPFYITIDPTSGPIGTKATVNGAWFPPQIQVNVTFNDVLMGYAVTDEDGDFMFVFNVPVSVAGVQTVRASFGEANFTSTWFTVIDVTPLDIEIDVGTIHFRGESAEFYIQTSFKGVAVNATPISARLYKPDGTTESLTVPSPIATGFYKIPYSIPVDAQNGTYALVIEASYTTNTIESHGTAFKTFLLSSTLAEELALIEDLGDEIENLKAEIATLNTTLNSLGETLTEELALTEEDLKAQIAALNTTLNSLNETITQLETRIDTIKSAQEAFTLPLYAAVVLALIAAVGAIVTILLRRKPTP